MRTCIALLGCLATGLFSSPDGAGAQERERFVEFEAVPGIPSLESVPGQPGAASVSGDPVRLLLRLRPGQTYRYVGEIALRGDLPGRGRRDLQLEQQVRIDVSERAGSRQGLVLKIRNERLKLDLRSSGAALSFDSLSEESRHSPLGRHFRSELFRWVELELNTDHRVVSVVKEGRISADDDDGFPHLPRFGPDELRSFVETLIQGLPDRAVTPGETWTLEGERSLEGSVRYEFELQHRYLGEAAFEGHLCHRIAVAGRLVGSMPASGGEDLDAGQARIDIPASTVEGEILFDPAIGLPRHLHHIFRLVLEIPQGEDGGRAGASEPLRLPVEQEMRLHFLQTSTTTP